MIYKRKNDYDKFCLLIEFQFPDFFRNSTNKAGADLGFSRGGGGRIFKKFSNILTTFFFFGSTKFIFIFRALPKHCFAPILAKFSFGKSRFLALFEKF